MPKYSIDFTLEFDTKGELPEIFHQGDPVKAFQLMDELIAHPTSEEKVEDVWASISCQRVDTEVDPFDV